MFGPVIIRPPASKRFWAGLRGPVSPNGRSGDHTQGPAFSSDGTRTSSLPSQRNLPEKQFANLCAPFTGRLREGKVLARALWALAVVTIVALAVVVPLEHSTTEDNYLDPYCQDYRQPDATIAPEPSQRPDNTDTFKTQVIRVVDGDTITLLRETKKLNDTQNATR